MKQDAKSALVAAWHIVSVLGAIAVIAPILFGDSVAGLLPPCPARLAGSSCVACGLTTAFIHIGAGRWAEALQAHSWSVALYLSLAGNAFANAAYSLRWLLIKERAICR